MTPLIPVTAPDESTPQPIAEETGVQPTAGAAEAITQPAASDAEESRIPPGTDSTPANGSTDDDPSAAPAAEEPDADVEKKKIAPIWIAVTLCVGLLIAVIYLGARIISAHRTAKPAPAIAATAIAPPIPTATIAPPIPTATIAPPVQKPVERPVEATVVAPENSSAPQSPAAKDPLPGSITPQPGQRYLQVGALDYSEATRRFIEKLRGENLDPKVAPGPRPQLLRVLIGPFDSRDALEEKKAQIEAEGLDTFVREY
jgi:cell division septation protein DedD